MKHVRFTFLLLVVFLISFSCEQNPETEPNKANITFGFTNNVNSKLSETFNPKAILVSVANSDGVLVANLKRMELYNFSGSYLTNESLELLPGNYAITQLLVVDDAEHVTHVLPLEGSLHENLVEDAAPIHFAIGAGENKTQNIQVVKVEGSASDYGYITFEIEEILIDKNIKSIETWENYFGEPKLMSVTTYFYENNKLIRYEHEPKGTLNSYKTKTNIVELTENFIEYHYYNSTKYANVPKRYQYEFENNKVIKFKELDSYDGNNYELQYVYDNLGRLVQVIRRSLKRNGEPVDTESIFRLYELNYIDDLTFSVTLFYLNNIGVKTRKWYTQYFKSFSVNQEQHLFKTTKHAVLSAEPSKIFTKCITYLFDQNGNIIDECEYGFQLQMDLMGRVVKKTAVNPENCYQVGSEPYDGVYWKYIY